MPCGMCVPVCVRVHECREGGHLERWTDAKRRPGSAADFCLEYIRGAEVVGHLDEDGKVINRLNPDAKGHPRGGVRR